MRFNLFGNHLGKRSIPPSLSFFILFYFLFFLSSICVEPLPVRGRRFLSRKLILSQKRQGKATVAGDIPSSTINPPFKARDDRWRTSFQFPEPVVWNLGWHGGRLVRLKLPFFHVFQSIIIYSLFLFCILPVLSSVLWSCGPVGWKKLTISVQNGEIAVNSSLSPWPFRRYPDK